MTETIFAVHTDYFAMKRTIAIIAPLIDTRQYNMDFTLKLGRNNRELTLAAFYELANEQFKTENISRGFDYGEDIPAAGFYLEGLLHQHGYDTILTNQYDADTIKAIAKKDPFAVCISTTMIIAAESLLDLLSSVRNAMPATAIIAGGAFLWKNYLQYLKNLDSPHLFPLQPGMFFHPDHADCAADILVAAPHGISSLLAVLKELEKVRGASFEHIPNLCLPGHTGFNFTKREEEQVDYNEDYTRWDLIDEIPEKIPFRTSIGCPYRCRFCDFCQLYPHIFLRSQESLSKELTLVKNRLGQNPAIIHVSDDNVFINKKRVFEVCDAIADSGLNRWIGFMRGGEYSEKEMAAIERSGLMMGKIGVESGDPGQLVRMNKHQKIENVKRGVEQLDAHGISVLMTFVVGFPGETRQTLRNTADFLNSLSLANLSVGYQLYPLVIFPLSELADLSARNEWKIEGLMEKWSHYTMNSDDAFKACFDLFKEVTNLPYSYSEESPFFNRGMFTFDTRKSLFRLRHQLTIMLIEKAPWEQIEPVLKSMAKQMEISVDQVGESLRQEISVLYTSS
jgi:anaerobic magnesium-protoporphyrin IX monomethyl ester cyclase